MNYPQVQGKPKLTWSMLDTLMRCHYAFTAQYVHQMAAAPSRFALSLFEGSVLHAAMARWWKMRSSEHETPWLGGCVERAFAEEEANQRPTWYSSKSESLIRVKTAAENAVVVLGREDLIGEPLGVEERFSVEFEGFHLSGRFDLFVQTELADVLVDYKYSENVSYGHRYQLIMQAIGARATAEGCLPDAAGFLYCKGAVQRFRSIRFNETEVAKFGEKLVELWSDYMHEPNDKAFDAYRCEWCNVKSHCDVYREATPRPRREEVPYAGHHDL